MEYKAPARGRDSLKAAGADVEVMEQGGTRLCVIKPPHDCVTHSWLSTNVEQIRSALLEFGAVVIRRSNLRDPETLGEVAKLVGGTLLEYTERSTPRSRVAKRVYTSTEYPPDQTIPQHNENAYSDTWPDHLFFLCTVGAADGGETPVADSRAVLGRLPVDLVQRFAEHGVLYTRAYHEGIGLSWQEAFQTESRDDVERYCRLHGIESDWNDRILRTRQRRPALGRHPLTRTTVWFNQAHLFHVNALPDAVREATLSLFGAEELPRNVYYGDGTAISDADYRCIQDAYAEATLARAWCAGDLLIVDNVLMSHGRRPYQGPRQILVSMTRRASDQEVAPEFL